jgi:hypothetical protein
LAAATALDVVPITVGDARVRRAHGRIEIVEVSARGRFDELAVDELQDLS